jgi:hypothetical protein
MKAIEIEAWTLRVLDSVQAGAFAEDSLVELKANWPDARKAARQIAGHANAARGEPILWIIGADEKTGVKGADFKELSSWHAQVHAEFDGVSPPVDSVNVPFQNSTVAALCFDTERAPFVVKNPAFNTPGGGAASLEVPWREGTRTRTATRADLIRILAPKRLHPKLEVLRGTLHIKTEAKTDVIKHSLHAFIEFYISPKTDQVLVFPNHRMSATAASLRPNNQIAFGSIHFSDASKRSSIMGLLHQGKQQSVTVNARLEPIEITASEIIVRGPRKLILHADASLQDLTVEQIPELRFDLSLITAQDDVRCGVSALCKQRPRQEKQATTWDVAKDGE